MAFVVQRQPVKVAAMNHSAGDHKWLLAGLSAQQRERLTRRSNIRAIAPMILHCGLIGVCLTLILFRVPAWQLLILPMGILLVFLFTVLHEATHRTLFKSRRINISLAWCCGVVVLVPPLWFRYFHFEHHRHTQDPDRDPELAQKKPATLSEIVWHISGIPVWYSQIKTLLVNAGGRCKDTYVPATAARSICRESRVILSIWLLVIVLAVGFSRADVLMVWCAALLSGQPFLRLYLMAEHGRCPLVANMFENTRTVFTHYIIRKLAWNMPFHAEHHAYPNVPYYNLPRFHRLIKTQLKVTSNGYLEFHRDTLRSL